jgi:hypothetical protein
MEEIIFGTGTENRGLIMEPGPDFSLCPSMIKAIGDSVQLLMTKLDTTLILYRFIICLNIERLSIRII